MKQRVGINERVSTIQRITPINVQQEKQKFFFDEKYNPQFEYKENLLDTILEKYGRVSGEHLSLAVHILEMAAKQWKTETEFLKHTEGEPITKDQAMKIITEYLEKNDVHKRMKLAFSYNVISRTSIYKNTMNIRLPMEYRSESILGMLDHEIGTHVFRRLNEEKQPWYKEKKRNGLLAYMETEEGLAVLHSYVHRSVKLLRLEAVRYYTVYQAQRMSFAEIFADLEKYIDSRERRWNACVRVKRGLKDTSKQGCFSRDQVYLSGLIEVLRWLVKHDFHISSLYLGKISVNDIEKAQKMSQNFVPILPVFAQDQKAYARHCVEFIKINGLEKVVSYHG